MKLLLSLLLFASVANAQTSKTEWVAVPVDRAASGSTTETLCAAAVKKLYGQSMACLKRITTSNAPVIPPTVQTWVRIASENQAFTVGTNQTVRFGKSGPYVQKVVTGVGVCSIDFFGSDPAPGDGKFCDVLEGSGVPPAPPTVPTLGSATLTWKAPATNADGTPLIDLAGYRVQYGSVSGSYTTSLDTNLTSILIPNLPSGKWFFVVRAIDNSGNASAPSTEVSKVIP